MYVARHIVGAFGSCYCHFEPCCLAHYVTAVFVLRKFWNK